MADLTFDFIGIKCPNQFWLSSVPPTNKVFKARRMFEAVSGKLMKEPEMMGSPSDLFDGKRMIYGGFEMVQRKRKG